MNWKYNKKVRIILLVMVIATWTFVLWYYLKAVNIGRQSDFESTTLPKREAVDSTTHILSLDYPDPFNVGSYIETAAVETEDIVEQSVIWPDIKFYGHVAYRKRRLALLEFDGNELSVGEGEYKFGLKVLKVFNDSVQLQYENEKRFYPLSK